MKNHLQRQRPLFGHGNPTKNKKLSVIIIFSNFARSHQSTNIHTRRGQTKATPSSTKPCFCQISWNKTEYSWRKMFRRNSEGPLLDLTPPPIDYPYGFTLKSSFGMQSVGLANYFPYQQSSFNKELLLWQQSFHNMSAILDFSKNLFCTKLQQILLKLVENMCL